MRWLNIGLILALYALGVSFAYDWRPWAAITAFWPWPAFAFLVSYFLLAFLYEPARMALDYMLSGSARKWMIACGTLTFTLALVLTYGPLEGIPHVPDDIAYLWQARTFALGRLYMPSHDLPEFFHLLFMVNDGKWYSLFQPGWPAILTPAVFFGAEFVVNPLLGAIATVLVYPIGRRVFSEKTAKLAMLVMAISPMHVAISATLLAHSTAMVMTELSVLFTFRIIEKDRARDALLLGGAMGLLFATRALNAVAMVPVLLVPLLAFVYRGQVRFKTLLWGLPLAVLFFGLQLAYNNALTGAPLYWPQDRYFDISEPKPGCHRLGFGTEVGCPVVHPGEDFPEGFTPKDAVGVLHKRMGTFLLTLLGFQMIFLFVGAPFLSRRGGWRKAFLLAVFLSLIVAYFFWYFHGLWGRYYYEGSFALFLLCVAGVVTLHRKLGPVAARNSTPLSQLIRAAAPAVLAGYFAFNLLFFLPYASYTILAKSFFNVDRRVERLTRHVPEQSIIFMEDWYQLGFIIMRPGLPDQRLCVHDMGKHNALIMQYYPDWHFYRYNAKDDKLTAIENNTSPSPVFVECERKVPINDSSGRWSHPIIMERASDKMVLVYDAEKPGDFVAFRQFIYESGDYNLALRLATGPDRGIMRLRLDDQSCEMEVDLYSPEPGLKTWRPRGCQPFMLARGQHRFAFEVSGKNAQSEGYTLGLDYLLLERIAPPKDDAP